MLNPSAASREERAARAREERNEGHWRSHNYWTDADQVGRAVARVASNARRRRSAEAGRILEL